MDGFHSSVGNSGLTSFVDFVARKTSMNSTTKQAVVSWEATLVREVAKSEDFKAQESFRSKGPLGKTAQFIRQLWEVFIAHGVASAGGRIMCSRRISRCQRATPLRRFHQGPPRNSCLPSPTTAKTYPFAAEQPARLLILKISGEGPSVCFLMWSAWGIWSN